MIKLISLLKIFTAPVFSDDEEKTRSAYFINIIVLSNIPILLFYITVRAVIVGEPFGIADLILSGIITALIIVWLLMRRGQVRLAGYLHVITIWLASNLIALSGSGVRDATFTSFFVVTLMAGLLLGWKPAIGFTFLNVLAGFGLAYAENAGIIKYLPGTAISVAIQSTVLSTFGAIFLYLIINSLEKAIENSKTNAIEFQNSTKQLTDLRDALEVRVEQRTNELARRNQELDNANKSIQRRAAQFEALAQVTQTITAIRDIQQLLPNITSVISEKFDFYHVGIFLLDEINQFAILSAANSEGGKRMLERHHRLRIGEEGIVGYAAATGEPRIAMDVGEDAIYFNNPHLPKTRSEMALPLISKNIIIGALDVQSTELEAFTKDDIQMLSLLADQVSLAIENARLFDETRKALSESEIISRRAVRDSWSRLPEQQKLMGYRYNVTGATPLREPINFTKPGSSQSNGKEVETNQAIVPIELRGEAIGKLVIQSASGIQWNEDQLDLIKAVAERVALSAENARLFEETTARAEREKLVSDITSKIRSHNDPQAMIETAISELREALGASRVEVIPQPMKDVERNEA